MDLYLDSLRTLDLLGSRKLERGCRMIYAGCPSFLDPLGRLLSDRVGLCAARSPRVCSAVSGLIPGDFLWVPSMRPYLLLKGSELWAPVLKVRS